MRVGNWCTQLRGRCLSWPPYQLDSLAPLFRGKQLHNASPLTLHSRRGRDVKSMSERVEWGIINGHEPEGTYSGLFTQISNASIACLCLPRAVQHFALTSKQPVHWSARGR